MLEKTLEGLLENKKIQPAILNEISPEYSLEGRMLKPIFWPPDMKNSLI